MTSNHRADISAEVASHHSREHDRICPFPRGDPQEQQIRLGNMRFCSCFRTFLLVCTGCDMPVFVGAIADIELCEHGEAILAMPNGPHYLGRITKITVEEDGGGTKETNR